MPILNPARNTAQLPAPLFELRGALARLDLSAIIAATVLAIGISSVGADTITQDFLSGGLGVYVMVGSYVAFIASVLYLQKSMRLALSATSFGTAQSLVTHGIFKFSRNPIYLAFFLPLASLAYFSFGTAIASIVIYVTLMNLTVIRKEERDLNQIFGENYAVYRNTVPRWFA
jgi:protein-S-isoprenylcysteine O-methyltransferase Ste14